MGEGDFKDRGELISETPKREISGLRLRPGQMISENDICDCSDVLRTSIRDALRLLQGRGFMETVSYRGTYVTLLNLNNIKQMIYIWVAVETMVFRDLIRVRTSMVMEDIRHVIAQQKALTQESGFELEQLHRMDTQTHPIRFRAVKRQKLREMLQVQQLYYTRFCMLGLMTEMDLERIIEEYGGLFQLISRGDKKGLKESLKEHLHYSMEHIYHSIEVDYKNYFEEEPEEGRFVI